jgi:thioredoxin-dependent peroxiredoxin
MATETRMPQAGQPAPAFELPDDSGRLRSLADERGSWLVLYFYPKDDTPGCATEACSFRDANEEILARGARVLGVSVLDSESKARFKSKYGLPFDLLADEDHAVAERYGTWVEKTNYGKTYMGVQRATLLIDPQGVIRRVWPSVKPDEHVAQVLDALDEEQAADTLRASR